MIAIWWMVSNITLSSVFHMLIYIFLTFYHSNDICGIVISSSFTFLTFLPVQTKIPIQRHLFLHVFCCQYLPSPLHNRFFIVSLSSSADSPSLSNQIYPVCILISADMSGNVWILILHPEIFENCIARSDRYINLWYFTGLMIWYSSFFLRSAFSIIVLAS